MEVVSCNTKPCAGKAYVKRFDDSVLLQSILEEIKHEHERDRSLQLCLVYFPFENRSETIYYRTIMNI